MLPRFVRYAAVMGLAALVTERLSLPLLHARGIAHGFSCYQTVLLLFFVLGFLGALIGAPYYLARLGMRIPNPILASRTRLLLRDFFA